MSRKLPLEMNEYEPEKQFFFLNLKVSKLSIEYRNMIILENLIPVEKLWKSKKLAFTIISLIGLI